MLEHCVFDCVMYSWSESIDKALQSMEQRGDGDSVRCIWSV